MSGSTGQEGYACYPWPGSCPAAQSWKDTIATDSDTVPVGGETCTDLRNACTSVSNEMAYQGYTFLNTAWWADSSTGKTNFDSWLQLSPSCHTQVRTRMGYRIEWGDYFFPLEPINGVDRPQMDALESHLAPTPSCQSQTYEAESMYHSNGGTVPEGWSLWSNGYMSTSHAFAGGSTTLTVSASGTPAAGVWPHMVVSIGGVQVGSVHATTWGWTQYTFTFNATAGTKELRVAFDNDLLTSTEDRNLRVDKVVVGCPSP
jgi:hypothetical protein